MIAVTLRAETTLDDAARGAVADAVRSAGGSIAWRTDARARRTYALVELPEAELERVRAAAAGLAIIDGAIIALAVYPSVPEALPYLREALAGDGRPEGVLGAEPSGDGIVVEWNPVRTAAGVVMGVIDAELARFAASRRTALLSPLTPALEAAVAAGGLATPEITPDRVLETALDRVGIRV